VLGMRGGARAALAMNVEAPAKKVDAPPGSLLAQLADVTTLSIDTGDLDILEAYSATGMITDATTNPLFVSQAGLSGDVRYVAFVDKAIAYAKENAEDDAAVLELAMDRLAVELGLEIVKLVPGYVSTEVDIRASFDKEESLRRARRIIEMYEAAGVPRSRVLVKLAGTWEGIQAAKELEKEGITCNITLIFGFIQAVAAAQAGARLISPFPGRIKDWHAANGGEAKYEPSADPGVVCVGRMYEYYKKYGHEGTICMPASWRPSRGTDDPLYAIDEIVALAGVDRMTIPPPLLELLAATEAPLQRMYEPDAAATGCTDELMYGGDISEADFRMAMNVDVCATTKMAEGINSFIGFTEELQAAIKSKL